MYALMGAIALTGTAGFTACSSDDALTDVAPSISGETVKTQFAINIPHAGGQGTRMSSTVTQNGTAFRGMGDIRLVPFVLKSSVTPNSNPLDGMQELDYNAITLPDISKGAPSTGNDGGLISSSNSKIYKDIDIPLGTNAFLFYGEALDESAENGLTVDQTNGVLNPSYKEVGLAASTAISTISFDLQSILDDKTVTEQENALTGMLNEIAKTTGTTGANTAWSAVTTEQSPELHEYYQSFTSTAFQAGSANSIRLALQDLYNAMKSPRVTEYEGLKEAIASAILGEEEKYFTATNNNGTYTLTYNTNFVGKNFPSDVYLPDGAVRLQYSDGTFSYATNADNTGLNVTPLSSYVYPASLYYWVNSTLKTATTSQSSAYNGTNDWSTILNNYTAGGSVAANTQSVAIEKTINYAVGRFDVNIKFNSGEIKDADNEKVTLPANGFQLTGVLIGGQKNAGWNFAPTGDTQYTIYDAAVPTNTFVNRTEGLKNSTLVLETAGQVTEESSYETINFALEFVNNSSEAFKGKDGIIPVGGKFYLVGNIHGNSDHNKVFQQDYYTTAKVTINSLENALNNVPDLRVPQLELGLSVDLTWRQGLTDDVVIE